MAHSDELGEQASESRNDQFLIGFPERVKDLKSTHAPLPIRVEHEPRFAKVACLVSLPVAAWLYHEADRPPTLFPIGVAALEIPDDHFLHITAAQHVFGPLAKGIPVQAAVAEVPGDMAEDAVEVGDL